MDIQDWNKDGEHRNAQGVYVQRKGAYITIGNPYLERIFRVSEDVVRTVDLVNKVSGRPPQFQEGSEFIVALSGTLQGEFSTQDFRLAEIGVADQPDHAMRLTFTLKCRRDPQLQAQVIEEAYPERKYQRKWLTFHWSGAGDVVVDRVDVECFPFGWWYVGAPQHAGYGQPLFVGDLYLGLEYPGAEVSASYLRHYPGRSARGGLQSKTAIWGVAKAPGQVRAAFFKDYLDTVVTRRQTPFVIYNLLELGTPNEKLLTHWIHQIGQEAKRGGVQIDSFAIDDGWQDESTVWEPHPLRFPEGFQPLVTELEAQDSRLGLWLSLCGHTLNTRWGRVNGLEVSQAGDRGSGGYYCLAGPNYRAKLEAVLDRYLRQDHVNYLKCDYNSFGCNDASHGHPTGAAGKEAEMDAYIDILKHIRSVAPNVKIAITSGMWLSPWWTLYADYVWLGGSDGGAVDQVQALTPHDSFMTYRDTIMYDDFAVNKYVFPYSALMTHGFWASGASLPKFKDDVMLTIGRGITKWEMLNSPQEMNAPRYAFMGKAMRWGKANWDILEHTEMILGNPGKGEVYGYTHVGEGAALVFLRNPGLDSKLVDVNLAALGIPAGTASRQALEIYPANGELEWRDPAHTSLQVQVLGSECKCIAIVWDPHLVERLKL